jgi:hypothetical protein
MSLRLGVQWLVAGDRGRNPNPEPKPIKVLGLEEPPSNNHARGDSRVYGLWRGGRGWPTLSPTLQTMHEPPGRWCVCLRPPQDPGVCVCAWGPAMHCLGGEGWASPGGVCVCARLGRSIGSRRVSASGAYAPMLQ